MAILESDIKILKSAVMADTSDGGGAMTGVEVVDGLSNSMFPDTSSRDRAAGRFNMRKLFGVAHTDNTDMLLGAQVIITDAPDDPLVHCALMQTSGWADARAVAKDVIERYVVKGSRMGPRLLDTHYEGSLQVRLFSPSANVDFPKAGDAICLAAPDGHEQYVRVTKIAFTTQTFFVTEGSGTVEFVGTIGTCDLGARLDHDFVATGASRLPPAYAGITAVYNTTYATGAQFYGIKPLTAPAGIGDLAAFVSGIFTPLIPAATVESPIIDVYPLNDRTGIAPTAQAALTLDNFTAALAAGAVLTTPTPISPGSLLLVAGGNTFTDVGGELRAGTLAIGTVDYKTNQITFASTSPNYGTASCTLTYRPATVAPMANHSASFKVTSANQGRAYVNAFEPPPAPGTFTLSYMSQARWYDLKDSGFGKLSGGDSSYGAGTVDSVTGSMAATLGALPDIGSVLIADWGDKASATAVAPDRLPLKLSAWLPLPDGLSTPITLTWSSAGTPYTAVIGTSGFLTGDAAGNMSGDGVVFEPRVFPDGPVTVEGIRYESRITETTAPVVNTTPYVYQADASLLPIGRGTFRGVLAITGPTQALFPLPPTLNVYDRGGLLFARYSVDNINANAEAGEVQVGEIDYTTGRIRLLNAVYIRMWFAYESVLYESVWTRYGYSGNQFQHTSFDIAPFNALTAPSYSMGTTTTNVTTYETVSTQTPVVDTATASKWTASIRTGGVPLLMSNMAFKLGGEIYTVSGGVLRKGWNPVTGKPEVASAGTLTSDGVITVATLPANFTNGIVWSNAVQDVSAKLVGGGVFRTTSAPLKTGVMQLQSTDKIANADESGKLSGGNFYGSVDFQRGVVEWECPMIPAASLSYNAVFLQYLPLNGALLGLDTARLPIDGRVPIYRSGDLQVVHNTQTYALPNPLVKGQVYSVGRVRLAAMKAKTATGVTVDTTKYTTDLDAGTIVFPADADLSGLAQPFSVAHRIEDMVMCSVADISGKLTFTSRLTHAFPAGTSFVSSALEFGDRFARAYNPVEQATWTGEWSDLRIGSAPTANFNEVIAPLTTTNRGAIAEQWALIFTNTTTFRIIGHSVGEIGTGNTATDCAPINPATGVPYFTIPALGWGNGWVPGNVYRFNTAACGAPFWVVRTVLQGPATLQDDKFTLAFRGDVDRP